MLNSSIGRRLGRMLLGLAGFLCLSSQSSAAVFVGAFDPSFGADYPALGFRGQGLFDISDTCLNAGTGYCSPPGTMTSATVELYAYDPENPQPSTQASAIFGPQALSSSYVGGGTLIAAGTPIMEAAGTFVVGDGGSIYKGKLWFEFDAITAIFGEFQQDVGTLAFIYACRPLSGPECTFGDTVKSDGAVVHFERQQSVPEPTTAGLVLLALGAAAYSRRRR